MADDQRRLIIEESPIVRIAHDILHGAISHGADALRLVLELPGTGVRSSVSVQCHANETWSDLPSMPQFPGNIYGNIVRRFQILADVNAFSRKGLQEGHFLFRYEVGDQPSKDYLIHASFREAPSRTTTVLTIQDTHL